MTKSFVLAFLLVILSAAPGAMAQSNEAVEACRDVDPASARRACMKGYDAKHGQNAEIQQRKKEIDILQQRQGRPGTNCTYSVVGATVQKTCN